MKTYNRKSIFDDLNKYSPFAKEESYIEITEWSNGEGWDIDLDGTMIKLTIEELDAINYLIKTLSYNNE